MSEKKLAQIEVRAIRTKEAGTFERLLCQLLIRANASDGLKKIELMCQAYYRAKPLLPQNPIQINEDEVEIIHKVVTGLKYATRYSLSAGGRQYIQVSWPFKPFKESFDRYIAPWGDEIILQYYAYIGGGMPYEIEEAEKKFIDYLDGLERHMYFFCITMGMERHGGKLSESGFDRVCGQFIVWAMPKVEEWYLELTKLVDPSLFDQIFRTMFAGEKKTTEKEEE